jgi:hypothetical protein
VELCLFKIDRPDDAKRSEVIERCRMVIFAELDLQDTLQNYVRYSSNEIS